MAFINKGKKTYSGRKEGGENGEGLSDRRRTW